MKVTAATLAAAAATLLVWILNSVLPHDHQISDPIQGTITTLLVGLVGYFIPPAAGDQVVETKPHPA
jgi:H+/Cl- antiporter ClcA